MVGFKAWDDEEGAQVPLRDDLGLEEARAVFAATLDHYDPDVTA
jgi:hypothetical protein